MITFAQIWNELLRYLPFDVPVFDPTLDWIFTGWALVAVVHLFSGLLVISDYAFLAGVPTWSRSRRFLVALVAAPLWPLTMPVDGFLTLWRFARMHQLYRTRRMLLAEAALYRDQADGLDGTEDAHAATLRHAASVFETAAYLRTPLLHTRSREKTSA